MCSPVKCRNCGKTTWSGCGRHVDQVMSHVPKSQQCVCDRNSRPKSGTGNGTGTFAGFFAKRGQR